MVAISSPKKVVLTFRAPFDQATFRGLLAQQDANHAKLGSITNTFTINNGSKCWMQTLYDFIPLVVYRKGHLPPPSRPSAVARWAAHPSAASALRSVVYRRLNRAPAGKHLQCLRMSQVRTPLFSGSPKRCYHGTIPHGVVMFQLAMFDGTRG